MRRVPNSFPFRTHARTVEAERAVSLRSPGLEGMRQQRTTVRRFGNTFRNKSSAFTKVHDSVDWNTACLDKANSRGYYNDHD